MVDIIGTAQLMLDNLGANKAEFGLSIVLIFLGRAGKGKLATLAWLIGGFFLLDSLGLWNTFLELISNKTGLNLTALSLDSIKDAIGGMTK